MSNSIAGVPIRHDEKIAMKTPDDTTSTSVGLWEYQTFEKKNASGYFVGTDVLYNVTDPRQQMNATENIFSCKIKNSSTSHTASSPRVHPV